MAKKKFNPDEALELLDLPMEDDEDDMDFEMEDDEDDMDFEVESQEDLASQLISELKAESPDAMTVVSILESLIATMV